MKPLSGKTTVAVVLSSVLTGLLGAGVKADPVVHIHLTDGPTVDADQQVDDSYFDAYLLPASEDAGYPAPSLGVDADPCTGCLPPSSMYTPSTLPTAPSQPMPAQTTQPLGPPPADFSGQFQGGALLASRDVPAMFGDFFGAGGVPVTVFDDGFPLQVIVPDPSTGGAAVGRQKLAENTSPVPRDRVFLNYSFFDNTPLIEGGLNVNRFTPGFEKTFLDEAMSIEVRFPVATTLDNDVTVSQVFEPPYFPGVVDQTNTDSGQLGNITLFLKGVLAESESVLLTAGLGVAVPTAEDFRIMGGEFLSQSPNRGQELLKVENRAVHLLPFLGGVYAPNERFFSHFLLQFDVDANGQRVSNSVFTGQPVQDIGTVQDRTYLFLDASAGFWLFRDRRAVYGLSGIAPVIEMHYNQSLTDTDTLVQPGPQPPFPGPPPATGLQLPPGPPPPPGPQPPPLTIIPDSGDLSLVNVVVGLNLEFGENVYVQAGYGLPVTDGTDQQFDGEFRLLFNWLFGRSASRARRAPTFR